MSKSEPHIMESQNVETTDGLTLIGKLAVRFHMIDDAQLERALGQQSCTEPKSPMGQTLVDMELLSSSQLEFLLNAQAMKAQRSRDMKFGCIAVENGFVTEEQVMAALKRQKEAFIKKNKSLRIGDILLASGLINEEQKQAIIQAQQRIKKSKQPLQTETEVMEPPVSIEEGVVLSVSKDGMRATLRAVNTLPESELRPRIDELMEEYGICFGRVADQKLSNWLMQGETREERFVIAEGKAPIPGHGGELSYHFDTDPLKAGKIKEGDIIDFKDRGEIPQVDEGALLAEISEPDPGVSGTDVYGEVIAPPTIKATTILCDTGVILSDDGIKATAQQSGSPSLSRTGALSVFPLYQVEGDVGYKTGHIDFDGDIQVSGTVEKDFRVKGGKLTANEVEAAEIDVKGDVVIRGGVLGARIKAGGNLMAAYIHNSVIEVGGDVLVQKEIRGCDIKSGGGLYSKSSIILDSHIAAKDGIVAKDIGSEVSGPSSIHIGSDALLELRIKRINESNSELKKEQQRWRDEIEALSAENEQINTEIAEQAQVQDLSQVEQRELAQQKEQLIAQGDSQQLAQVEQKIVEDQQRASAAEEQLNTLFDRQDQIAAEEQQKLQQIEETEQTINLKTQELQVLGQQITEQQEVNLKITGTLYPMTSITTPHTSVKTKQAMKSLLIREAMRRNQAGDELWKIVTEGLG